MDVRSVLLFVYVKSLIDIYKKENRFTPLSWCSNCDPSSYFNRQYISDRLNQGFLKFASIPQGILILDFGGTQYFITK